jgi:hypothetical protein
LRAGAAPAFRDRVGRIRYGLKGTAAAVAKPLGTAEYRAWLDEGRFRVAVLLCAVPQAVQRFWKSYPQFVMS